MNLTATIDRESFYQGEIVLDRSKPDGTLRKLLSVDKIKELGWEPKYSLRQGIEETYRWFVDNF